jgi:hypothetical protein
MDSVKFGDESVIETGNEAVIQNDLEQEISKNSYMLDVAKNDIQNIKDKIDTLNYMIFDLGKAHNKLCDSCEIIDKKRMKSNWINAIKRRK